MTDDTPPTARYWRARIIYRQPFVRLFADQTVAECVGTLGPFDTWAEAIAAGEATGLPDGDK